MLASIIYAHPYEKSFNSAIKERVTSVFEEQKIDFNIIDLYFDNFNPAMSAEDLKLYRTGKCTDSLVEKYIDILSKTELIIIIFPIWWGICPAVLAGFFDKVLLPGRAYDTKSSGLLRGKFSNIKKAVIFNTMGGPKFYHNFILRFPVKQIIAKTTLKSIGVKKTQIVQFDMIKNRSPEELNFWLEQTEKITRKNICKFLEK